MSDRKRPARWQELVSIGRVARPQGRVGEVVLDALAEPTAIEGVSRVYVQDGGEGGCRGLVVESVRIHKGRPVMRLEGTPDISAAEALAGVEMRVEAGELGTLPGERYFHYQLVGLQIWDAREGFVGVVRDCVSTAGSDVLVVEPAAESAPEVLIPFCPELCPEVDLDRGRIQTKLPEGLVALNAH